MSRTKGLYGNDRLLLNLLRQAKAVVIHGDRFTRCDECALYQLLGLCRIAGLVFDYAEQVQGVGMLCITGKNFVVDRFGCTKLTFLVVLERCREGLGDGG